MRRRAGGFSLIELIVVIVIAGILAGMISSFILRPIQGSVQLARRAALVDQADLALRRLARDIRLALPNSVRVTAAGDAIEFLPVLDAATYRAGKGNNIPLGGAGNHNAAGDEDWLNFAGDSAFNVLGRFTRLGLPYGSPLPAGTRLAIYTTDAEELYADAAAAAGSGVITPPSTAAAPIVLSLDQDEDRLTLPAPFVFRYASPAQRVFVVRNPVSYACSGGALRRYEGYPLAAVQPQPGSATLGAGHLIADRLTSCGATFAYVPGTPQRAGLVTIRLTLQDGEAGTVELLRHVHAENTP